MCGIFGILYHNSGRTADANKLNETAGLLHHRGPDAVGAYSEANISLVHTRLSLLDLSDRSNQPFWDKDNRYVIVYNGEIYNFKELRSELERKGVEFRTTSDTEVLMACILTYGLDDALMKFEGMFAFAFYDTVEGELSLARDRYGIKPLFIYDEEDAFVFASEIMAMRPWIEFRPDMLSVSSYLLGFAGPTKGYTFYQKIKIFPPGHVVTIKSGQPSAYRHFFEIVDFWDPELAAGMDQKKQGQIIDSIDEHLFESVRKQLIADGPVGALCSGGIDSSIIMAMASRIHNNLAIFHANVEGPNSEYRFAKKLSETLRLDLKTTVITDGDILAMFPVAMKHYGQPFTVIPSSIPFLSVSKLVRESGVKAVLTGEGSDEFFLGYPFLVPDVRQWKRYVQRGFRNVIKKLFVKTKLLKNTFGKRREFVMGFSPYSSSAIKSNGFSHTMAELNLHLGNRFEVELETRNISDVVNPGGSLKCHKYAARSLDLLNYNLRALLHRNDAMGMAASIESRFPFLDHALAKLTVSLPDRYKIRFDWSSSDCRHYFYKDKWVLRKVAERYLPNDIGRRPKGFFWVDTFSRMKINPVFFKKSIISDLLDISSSEIGYLMDRSPQDLKLQLLHLEVWAHVCLNGLPEQPLKEKLRESISIKPHP
jgi:asparagine synthase (glutamine-hydrolysing)